MLCVLVVVASSAWLAPAATARLNPQVAGLQVALRAYSLYAALPQRIRLAATLLSPINAAARLHARVLIASAPHDKYFPPDETRALAQRAPHVALTVTPTLQHAIPHFSVGDLAGLFRFDGFLARVLRVAG